MDIIVNLPSLDNILQDIKEIYINDYIKVYNIYLEALNIFKTIDDYRDNIDDLREKYKLIYNHKKIMDKILIKNIPIIPIKFLIEYTKEILDTDELYYLYVSPLIVKNSLKKYCITYGIFDSDVASVYIKGWNKSSVHEGDIRNAIKDIIHSDIEHLIKKIDFEDMSGKAKSDIQYYN